MRTRRRVPAAPSVGSSEFAVRLRHPWMCPVPVSVPPHRECISSSVLRLVHASELPKQLGNSLQRLGAEVATLHKPDQFGVVPLRRGACADGRDGLSPSRHLATVVTSD